MSISDQTSFITRTQIEAIAGSFFWYVLPVIFVVLPIAVIVYVSRKEGLSKRRKIIYSLISFVPLIWLIFMMISIFNGIGKTFENIHVNDLM